MLCKCVFIPFKAATVGDGYNSIKTPLSYNEYLYGLSAKHAGQVSFQSLTNKFILKFEIIFII